MVLKGTAGLGTYCIDGSRSHVDATEIISIQVCIHFSVKLFRDSKTINEDRGT